MTDNPPARPAPAPDGFLRGLWYYALPARTLAPGRMRAVRMLGTALLVGRAHDGTPFALRDVCPHRGMPLSYGRFDGREVECPYHGWRFSPHGHCTAIPSLTADQAVDLSRIRVERFACALVQGGVWVYFGDGDADPGAVPRIADVTGEHVRIHQSMIFPCHVDHAVIGLMDPAHGPFVHRAWWWRSAASIHEKHKRFAPSHLGFCMVRHRPSSNSRAYRILGGTPHTEIRFQLPGVRIEHVEVGAHRFCGLTAVTPLDEHSTRVDHVIYWTMPWLTALKPLLVPFARAFLNQDRRVVARQQQGLAENPKLMLINDADAQARWYFRIKDEYRAAQAEGREFVNPVKQTTLRWRS